MNPEDGRNHRVFKSCGEHHFRRLDTIWNNIFRIIAFLVFSVVMFYCAAPLHSSRKPTTRRLFNLVAAGQYVISFKGKYVGLSPTKLTKDHLCGRLDHNQNRKFGRTASASLSFKGGCGFPADDSLPSRTLICISIGFA